jgi:tetratricopeptide (TPR) repeat protein
MNDPDELFRIALAHQQRNQFQQALAAYERVLPFMPDNPHLYYNRASVLSRLGRHAEALTDYDQSIVLKSDNHHAYFGRGNALDALGQLDAALASHEQAIRFKPDYWPACANRGFVLQKLNRLDEALLSIERAIALNPNEPMLHYNHARWLRRLNRDEEALTSYDRVTALRPDYFEAHYNRAMILMLSSAHLDEAGAALERALALEPQNDDALHAQAQLQLLRGNYARGLAFYIKELRGGTALEPREFSQAQWFGEDVQGKTLLLHDEQGFGDGIQMLRYLPQVKAKAARVVLELRKELSPLLGSLAEGIEVVERGAALPHIDLHCPLTCLPLAFDTRLDTIPAQIPYLTAPLERLPKWRARLPASATARVGLVWSTSLNPDLRNREIALTKLAPLLHIQGIACVSLQVQYRAGDPPLLAQLPIERLDDAIADFGDTAAAIEQCDLVISVDTAVAHLAGALGKPVWILLPFAADWRWLRERNDSPWYPTARLFRQSRLGDWESVIAKVARELEKIRHE